MTEDNIYNDFLAGRISSEEAIQRSRDLEAKNAMIYPNGAVSVVDDMYKHGRGDVINSHLKHLENMGRVTADNYVNVNIHDPHRMDIFYDRYTSFSDSVFDKLGFSPFRNNDAYYNANTSTLDNHVRTLKTMPGMVWNMMKQTWSLSDNYSSELAKEYEKMNAMAYDTRDSNSFYNNMLLSSSATLGILTSIAIEEGIGAVLGYFTGGAGKVVESGALLNNIRRVFNFKKAVDRTDDVIRVARTVDRIKDTSRLGEYFKDFGKNLNPLKNVTEFIGNAKGGALKNLSGLERFKRGSSAVWGDARTANLVYKESALEANLAKNEFTRSQIDKFVDEHGRMPSDAEIDEITRRASSVYSSVVMGNLAAIYLTDKITFNDLLDPVLTRTLRKGAGKLPENILHDKSGFFVSSWKDWIPGKHFKAKLKNSSGKLIDWSLGSVSEGLQENIQDVLADAAKSYYADTFNTDYGKNSFGEYINFMFNNEYMPQAIRNQISEQGLETFLSGALMGGPVTIVSRSLAQVGNKLYQGVEYRNVKKLEKKATDALNEFGEDSKQYKEAKANLETAQNQYNAKFKNAEENTIVDNLNSLRNDPKALSKIIQGIELNRITGNLYQSLHKDSTKETESEHDFALEQAFSYAMMYGQLDTILDHYEELKQNAGELYKQYGAENEQEFRDNVDAAIKKANKMAAVWENFDKKFPTQFHPENYRVGSEQYIQQLMGQQAERLIKNAAVFANEDFTRMVQYEQETLADLGKAFDQLGLGEKSMFHTDARVLLSEKDINAEIASIESMLGEYSVLGSQITPENKKRRDSLTAKLNALKTVDKALRAKREIGEYFSKLDTLEKEYRENQDKLNKKQTQLNEAQQRKDVEAAKSLKDEIQKLKKEISSYGNNVNKIQQTINTTYGISNEELKERNKRNPRERKKMQEKLRAKLDVDLQSSVREYFRWLSNEYGVDIKKLDTKSEGTAFDRLMKLYQNKERMSKCQNLLYNFVEGEGYYDAVNIVQKDLMDIHRNFFDIVLDSVRTFNRNKSTNELLNNLFDAGFWIDPNSLEELLKTGEAPTFFYVNDFKQGAKFNEDKGLPVIKGSEDYNKAIQIVMKYCNKNGIKLKNAQIFESTFEQRKMAAKSKLDNRTYKDLCDLLGIDIDATKSVKNARDVLELIANDKQFNLSMHREFARGILKYLDDHNIDLNIEFTFGQSEPVIVEDGVVKIDLRYASTDFMENATDEVDPRTGKKLSTNGYSFDFLVLKGVFTNIASDMIDSDSEFKSRISTLMQQTNDYIDVHANEFGDNVTPENVKNAYEGLTDEKEFVINAMLNVRFQELLQRVKTEETMKYKDVRDTRSAWEKFVDAVVNVIRQFNALFDNDYRSVLNNAVDVITAKLDGGTLQPQQNNIVGTQQQAPVSNQINPNTPTKKKLDKRTVQEREMFKPRVGELKKYPEVAQQLIDAFKAQYKDDYEFADEDVLDSALFYECYTNPSNALYDKLNSIVYQKMKDTGSGIKKGDTFVFEVKSSVALLSGGNEVVSKEFTVQRVYNEDGVDYVKFDGINEPKRAIDVINNRKGTQPVRQQQTQQPEPEQTQQELQLGDELTQEQENDAVEIIKNFIANPNDFVAGSDVTNVDLTIDNNTTIDDILNRFINSIYRNRLGNLDEQNSKLLACYLHNHLADLNDEYSTDEYEFFFELLKSIDSLSQNAADGIYVVEDAENGTYKRVTPETKGAQYISRAALEFEQKYANRTLIDDNASNNINESIDNTSKNNTFADININENSDDILKELIKDRCKY